MPREEAPQFHVGQRIRTTVDAPAGWEGAFPAPTGTLGTITGPELNGSYGVLLDGDPDQMAASYEALEMEPLENEAP